ncbi:pyridoxal phosphate-dependent transferase [Myxozyma melibiosi]|uniref:Pyridoxal phosphate-dependent transferase n=1 Tax=Myxozyma melibiosi TaxID=54550 RepID=A0ABR1FFX6_9ASCO
MSPPSAIQNGNSQLSPSGLASSSRAAELETLLELVSQRATAYVAAADAPGARIGDPVPPKELMSILGAHLSLPSTGGGQTEFLAVLDEILKHSIVTWHPGFMDKLYASTNPVGVASDLLLSILNTNGYIFSVSPVLTLIEKKTSHEYAELFGFTSPWSGGLTLPGGSASNTHSLIVARGILYPDTKLTGNGDHRFVIFTSAHGHYSVEKAAISVGLGSEAVWTIPVDAEQRMRVDVLEEKILEAKKQGRTPLYVNATAGTTVYGSYDPFEAIAAVAKRHGLWFHVDGSWGGNVVFSDKLKYKLKGVALADSLTVNPHKMLGVPLTCSFLLAPDHRVFQKASSLRAPYLFHNSEVDGEDFDIGDSTMGCGRRADSLKLFLGWKWYGKEGYGERVETAFEVTAHLATLISSRAGFHLLSSNPPPCLQTCFYYSPNKRDALLNTAEYNTKVTRTIAHELQASGRFLVDYAPPASPEDGKGEFFRAVVNAPTTTKKTVEELVSMIESIGESLDVDV